MSRLLTTLLLYRCGFYVGKYISLEAKIAKNKDMYYDALNRSQHGWHEGTEDVGLLSSTFWERFLQHIRTLVKDLLS